MSYQRLVKFPYTTLRQGFPVRQLVATSVLLVSLNPGLVRAQSAGSALVSPIINSDYSGAPISRAAETAPRPLVPYLRDDTQSGSVSRLSEQLSRIIASEAAMANLQLAGKSTPKPKNRAYSGDLAAQLQMIKMRAYPRDTVDGAAYTRALAHIKQMTAAKSIGANAYGSGTGSSGGGGGAKAAAVPSLSPGGGVKVTPAVGAGGGGVVPANGVTGATQMWSYVGPNNLPPPFVTNFGPLASIITGRVSGIAYDAKHSGYVYLVAPGGGLWQSKDSGTTWNVLSEAPNYPFARLQASCVAVSPSDGNTLLVGMGDFDGGEGFGDSVGIMRGTFSPATGWTWTVATPAPVGTGMASNPPLAGQVFSSIKFDPDNPLIVTATSGRSADATGAPTPGFLWHSTDGGKTWSAVLKFATGTAFPNGVWSTVSIGPKNANGTRTYWAALQLDGIYQSTDQGATWTRNNTLQLQFNNPVVGVAGEVGLEVAASQVDANTAYVVDAGLVSGELGDGRIYKTTNGGTTWADVSGNFYDGAAYDNLGDLITVPGSNLGEVPYDLVATTAAIPAANGTTLDTLYVGAVTLEGVTTNYSNWSDIGQTESLSGAIMHSNQHAMAINPANQATALVGNDGGLYGLSYVPALNIWSTLPNGGQTLNKTLGLTQINHMDFSPIDPALVILGAKDNALPVSVGNLAKWINPGTGSGAGCAINPITTSIQYGSAENQNIFITENLWQSSTNITYLNTSGVPWDGDATPAVGTFALSQDSPNFLYLGTSYIWTFDQNLFDQNLPAWTEHVGGTQLSPAGFITAIATSPLDADITSSVLGASTVGGTVYAGTSDGLLWMSINANSTDSTNPAKWVEIDTPAGGIGLPGTAVTSISVNPHNAFDILVGLGGTGLNTPHLMRCADTSNAPVLTFTNASGGQNGTPIAGALPDISLNDVVHDPGDPAETFYVATDLGVFSTINSGTTWQTATESLGLPPVQVNCLKVAAGYLNAGTFGRGLWRIALNEAAASLSVKTGLSRVGGNIVLTMLITNTGGSDATNMALNTANITVNGITTSANEVPLTIGTLSPGLSDTVTVTFPGTVGTSGSLASISGALTSSAGTFTLPSGFVRLP